MLFDMSTARRCSVFLCLSIMFVYFICLRIYIRETMEVKGSCDSNT